MPHDLLELSAVEQARLIRTRAISSEELTRFYLDRVTAIDPKINSFVTVFHETAIASARRKDSIGSRDRATLPPFHGVPIAVKDLNLVRGSVAHFGSAGWPRLRVPFDDRTTSRLRAAGFVILGKTTTSELGTVPVTEPAIHPPTRNPWHLEHTSGGSSGGSGAAVAAGLVPIAQGSDGAGSIRIPSSFCGLYGIKPTRGRVRNPYGLPDRRILYTCGPMARSVADAAALLDVLAGVSVGRPHWAPPPDRPFSSSLTEAQPRLRIRWVPSTPIVPTDPEVEAATRAAVRRLEALGHHVDEVEAPHGSIAEFLPIWQHLIAGIPLLDWSRTQPITRWLRDAGRSVDRRTVRRLTDDLEARANAWFGDADLTLSPTVPLPPPKVGEFRHLEPPEAFAALARLGVFTALYNLTGAPAASLPVGFTAAGLPIGLQIGGRPNGEAVVLRVSYELETALGLHRRCPLWRGNQSSARMPGASRPEAATYSS